jgi:hypothetical protein
MLQIAGSLSVVNQFPHLVYLAPLDDSHRSLVVKPLVRFVQPLGHVLRIHDLAQSKQQAVRLVQIPFLRERKPALGFLRRYATLRATAQNGENRAGNPDRAPPFHQSVPTPDRCVELLEDRRPIFHHHRHAYTVTPGACRGKLKTCNSAGFYFQRIGVITCARLPASRLSVKTTTFTPCGLSAEEGTMMPSNPTLAAALPSAWVRASRS